MHVRTRMLRGERGLTPVAPSPRPDEIEAERRIRIGATRLGIPYEEYREQVAAGNRWCSYHRCWQPADEFGVDKSQPDGVNKQCKLANREYHRRYQIRKSEVAS